jgi:hypothetical protein
MVLANLNFHEARLRTTSFHSASNYCGILQPGGLPATTSPGVPGACRRHAWCSSAEHMTDIIFIAGTCVFFVIAIAYVWGCTRL